MPVILCQSWTDSMSHRAQTSNYVRGRQGKAGQRTEIEGRLRPALERWADSHRGHNCNPAPGLAMQPCLPSCWAQCQTSHFHLQHRLKHTAICMLHKPLADVMSQLAKPLQINSNSVHCFKCDSDAMQCIAKLWVFSSTDVAKAQSQAIIACEMHTAQLHKYAAFDFDRCGKSRKQAKV